MGVIGIDISKYEVKDIKDDNGKVTSIVSWWNPDKSVKTIDFVIQRASYGGRQDEYLELLYKEALKISVRGAYHYFSTGITWKAQADVFLNAVKDKDYHFYMIDYETAYNNLNATSFAELFEVVKYVKAQTNKKVLIYFNPNVYLTYMKPFGADKIINNYDLVIARYPWKPFLNLNNLPTIPGITKQLVMWQYGAADVFGVPGYDEGFDYGSWRHGIDLDYFPGTLEELKVLMGVGGVVTPPEALPKLKITVYEDFTTKTEVL